MADVQNDPRTSSGLHLTIPAVANRPFSATHGVLATADLLAFEGSSLCELALTRTALGGPAIDSLTDLEAARRQHPAGRDGHSHVGLNDAARIDLGSARMGALRGPETGSGGHADSNFHDDA